MSKPLILRAAPQSAWDTIDATLHMDAASSAFDVSGAELVEWFVGFRAKAKALLEATK